MGFVIGIVVLALLAAALKPLVVFVLRVAVIALAVTAVLPFSPMLLAGFLAEVVLRPVRLRGAGVATSIAGVVLLAVWAMREQSQDGVSLDWAEMTLTAAFVTSAGASLFHFFRQRHNAAVSANASYITRKTNKACALLLAACAMAALAAAWSLLIDTIPVDASLVRYGSWVYFGAALLTSLIVSVQLGARTAVTRAVVSKFSSVNQLQASDLIGELTNAHALDREDVTALFNGIAANCIYDGTFRELDLAGSRWFFRQDWYDEQMAWIDDLATESLRLDVPALTTLTRHRLGLPVAANDDLVDRHLEFGEQHTFADGVHFVSFRRSSDIRTCDSCGHAEVAEQPEDKEWYCSRICASTEDICQTIRAKSEAQFLSEAASSGLVLMAGASAWRANHGIVATGSQGHGIAAEVANHRIDRILGRKAQHIGGDNAANGADRIVGGQSIQTKYCKTAGKSVGQAFDKNGTYRYRGPDGNPMQLEVPKDQYEKALEALRKRMKAGKVLGADGQPIPPEQAEQYVRKGHLTYKQAQQIVKFGTMESLAYDMVEGSISGLVAGGISFGITATLCYVSSGDRKAALRAASIQGAKTFGTAMVVHVSTQQLHRLAVIQSLAKHIDLAGSSSTTLGFFEKGLGVTGVNQANRALHGMLVTSVVLVAVTTAPDVVKLARGRMSQAQFFKNLTVTTSGVAGGAIGSMVGGVVLSPLGPAGAIAGRIAGGIVGGYVATTFATTFTSALGEDDRTAMMRIVSRQLEYLAKTFMLSAIELDNINTNLGQVVTARMLESLYGEKKNRTALANQYLKPTVVAVVRQRPVLTFEGTDVLDAWEALAA